MYYDDDMDYIYCLVGKVSCTSWKRTLMMLSGKIDRARFRRPEQLPIGMVHDHRNSYVSRVETLPQAERAWRFDRYFTFLFVREPLERLVSAYRNKVRRYNVTFAEFVRFVLDERAGGRVLDRHWCPQSELCRVCRHRYDFVGHHESLQRDARHVVDELKSRTADPERRRRVADLSLIHISEPTRPY